MGSPTFRKESLRFIGVINYYRDMWPRGSHTLAPLTKIIPNKVNVLWAEVEQDNFNKITRILARDTLLTYPNFNETFKIHTNASAFQLGAVIIQKGKPIVFYSRKLTDDQMRYTVTERKLINIVETLK